MNDPPDAEGVADQNGGSSPGPYSIEYTTDSRQHLRSLKAFERSVVLDRVDEQLVHEPTRPTRNRKPLQPNPIGGWELRIGDLRVLYDVDEESHLVVITAIGIRESVLHRGRRGETVKTIEISEATGTLAEYAYQSLTEPVTFTLDGKPLAFIASAVGADEETIALSASARLREIVERSRESYRRQGGIPAAEMRRQVQQWEAEEQAAGEVASATTDGL